MLCYLPKLLTVVEYGMFIAPQGVTPKILTVVQGTQILSLTKHCGQVVSTLVLQGAAFNVTHFESRITYLLYTVINTTEHGQVS